MTGEEACAMLWVLVTLHGVRQHNLWNGTLCWLSLRVHIPQCDTERPDTRLRC
jgi:hypothetical protein